MIKISLPNDPLIKFLFVPSITFLAVTTILIGISWTKLPPQVPLFYNKAWGQDQLASPQFLLIPLVFGFAIGGATTLLLKKAEEYTFLVKILILGASTALILLSITLLRITLLVL